MKLKLRSEAKYEAGISPSAICNCDSGSSAPPAPDYSQMAAATERAAQLSKELGEMQIAEARRQYDQNYATAKPVVDAQLGLMRQTEAQGTDYYNYMRDTFRPLERGMVDTANREASDARAEEQAATAAADARRGQTQQANQMIRQGLRYGYSPAKLAAMAGSMAGANSSAVAGAMTGARNNQRNIGWARSMDAAGLGRNLAGASQGAYGLSLNSGNSAVANQMQPGNALMSGLGMGAGTQMQGAGLQIQGLGSILNSQTSAYNAGQQNSGGGLGDILGAAGSIAMMGGKSGFGWWSDRRLKSDITIVGKDDRTGLNLYEFTYKDDPEQRRFRGVMADEAEKVVPDAVAYDEAGFAMVNYTKLGIQMAEV